MTKIFHNLDNIQRCIFFHLLSPPGGGRKRKKYLKENNEEKKYKLTRFFFKLLNFILYFQLILIHTNISYFFLISLPV